MDIQFLGRTSPTDLIGLGDWGYAWTIRRLGIITSLVKVHTIFGNHDDMAILSNVKNMDNSRYISERCRGQEHFGAKIRFH